MVVYPKRMLQNLNLTRGLIHSQQVLLLLTDKGISRETAYRIVQRQAMRSWETGEDFRTLIESEPEVMSKVKPRDLDKVFDVSVHFKDVNRTFRAVGL
jgi:adenylosuccinate lyase